MSLNIQVLTWDFTSLFSLFMPLLCPPLPSLHIQAAPSPDRANRHWNSRLSAYNPERKGSIFLKSRNILVRILIFPDRVTCSVLNWSCRPSTGQDISRLGSRGSTWNRFLMGKSILRGIKDAAGCPRSVLRKGKLEPRLWKYYLHHSIVVYFLKTNLN